MILSRLLSTIEYSEIIDKKGGGVESIDIVSLCCDSRKACSSSMFVCISGALSDGHEYAISAYQRMCRVFVAERPIDNLPDDAIVIVTPDTRLALAKLSDEFFGHPSKKLRIIGVTGTKGKTTTSLLIYNLLNANGIPTGYIGSTAYPLTIIISTPSTPHLRAMICIII